MAATGSAELKSALAAKITRPVTLGVRPRGQLSGLECHGIPTIRAGAVSAMWR
jgi:hypothetical protein